MKKHRWMLRCDIPAMVERNEDNETFFKIPENITLLMETPLPKQLYCYDCELSLESAFGNMCEAEYDLTIPKELWPQ